MRKRLGIKLAAVILTVGLAVATLTACGKDESGTRVVFTTGFGKDEIFRIEDISCSRAEVMIYLTTTQNQYEEVYGTEIWNTSVNGVTLEENVKENVLAKVAQVKTMCLLAEEKGLILEEGEEKLVEAAADEYMQTLNETEILLLNISTETVVSMYREYALAEKLYHDIIRNVNPEISDDEARTITVQHILLRTKKDDGQGNQIAYSESERQNAYYEALEIREKAVSGELDFVDLASKYSEAEDITVSFGKGETELSYEEAAFVLGTDEISPVIETEVGFYIIKCISTFNREETDANKQEILKQRRREAFGHEYDAFVETLVRSLNRQLWEEITFIHDSQVTTSDFFEVYGKYFSYED